MSRVTLKFDRKVDLIAIVSSLATANLNAKLLSIAQYIEDEQDTKIENHQLDEGLLNNKRSKHFIANAHADSMPPAQEALILYLAKKPNGEASLSEVAEAFNIKREDWIKKMRHGGMKRNSKHRKFYTTRWTYNNGGRTRAIHYVLLDAGRAWANK